MAWHDLAHFCCAKFCHSNFRRFLISPPPPPRNLMPRISAGHIGAGCGRWHSEAAHALRNSQHQMASASSAVSEGDISDQATLRPTVLCPLDSSPGGAKTNTHELRARLKVPHQMGRGFHRVHDRDVHVGHPTGGVDAQEPSAGDWRGCAGDIEVCAPPQSSTRPAMRCRDGRRETGPGPLWHASLGESRHIRGWHRLSEARLATSIRKL